MSAALFSKNKRTVVALFTSFHPDIGGGSVHLRNAIDHLSENFDIRWFYLGEPRALFSGTIWLGQSELGGWLPLDACNAIRLWAWEDFSAKRNLLQQIRSSGAEMLWVVAMGEGIAAGLTLLRETALPLHVSVHDDPAKTLAARSKRYRWLTPLVQRAFSRLLRKAHSVDVISKPMQDYYRTTLGVKTDVFYRHLPNLPAIPASPISDSAPLRMGHIGAVYGSTELAACLQAFGRLCLSLKRTAAVRFFGESPDRVTFMQSHLPPGSEVEIHTTTPEAVAVNGLAECDFVWAMYPFDDRSAMFRETSCPTKISSYLLAQRPIFAQTPSGSTLEKIVTTHQLGAVARDLSQEATVKAMEETLLLRPLHYHFEQAREELCGYHNIQRLQAAFDKLSRIATTPGQRATHNRFSSH